LPISGDTDRGVDRPYRYVRDESKAEHMMNTSDDPFRAEGEDDIFREADPWGDTSEDAGDLQDASEPVFEEPVEEAPDTGEALEEGEAYDSGGLSCVTCGREIEDVHYRINGEVVCVYCRELAGSLVGGGSRAARFFGASALGVLAAVVGGVGCLVVSGVFGDPGEFSNFGFGFLAFLVSLLVGFAVKLGSRRRGGWLYQGMAMILSYLAMVTTFIPGIHEYMATEESVAMAASPDEAGSTEAAANADTEEGASAIIWDDLDAIQKAAYCLFLYVFALLTPFLSLFDVGSDWGNATWFLFAAFAVGVAWHVNRRLKIAITGPFEASQVEADQYDVEAAPPE
jgi:hypothetical protein